ncbi:hypothetical protein UCRPC4_g05940 [Phaeomoniella chlamydospora]|uniref:Uncharacterized protein n=1 Tax=Phaeomoniella chlamydospora TaxID=158046 RepID=A0A0G2E247_PHACM|nr:hypothetical protein UCRPC4_g05940 [Phaeomoniella chlamydospora]
MPLASKFPVLIQCFISLASRVFDRKEALPESPRSIRYHTRVVQLVHQEMQSSERDDDSVILGILGAMVSNLVARSRLEFGIHARGLTNFVRIRGYPSYDPDVMAHYVSTSLMWGCQVVEALFGSPTSGPPVQPPCQDDVSEFLVTKNTLVALLLSAQAHIEASSSVLRTSRSTSPLFNSNSIFSSIAWRPLLHPTTNFWKKAFEIAHHPFLILYLYLLDQDLSSISPSIRSETETSLSSDFLTRNITKTSHCACINWYLLTKYKWESERAYLALQLDQVMLRMREHHRVLALKLLLWNLCPFGDKPDTTREMVFALGDEAADGLRL